MKKMIMFAGLSIFTLCATEASAQLGLSGGFSTGNSGGNYTVYCDWSRVFCGVVGAQQSDGRYWFKASNGSEWYITMSSTIDDEPGVKDEFASGVPAEAVLPEDEG